MLLTTTDPGPLTPLQLRVYKNFLDTEEVQLLTRKDEICDAEGCTSGTFILTRDEALPNSVKFSLYSSTRLTKVRMPL